VIAQRVTIATPDPGSGILRSLSLEADEARPQHEKVWRILWHFADFYYATIIRYLAHCVGPSPLINRQSSGRK